MRQARITVTGFEPAGPRIGSAPCATSAAPLALVAVLSAAPGCTTETDGRLGVAAQAVFTPPYSPAVMDAVNNALRAAAPGTYFDKLVDWGADDRIGVFPLPAGSVPLSATYWDDQQHPNGYGASIQAGMVAAGFIH